MKVLKMNVDTIFAPDDCEKKPLDEFRVVHVKLSAIEEITPITKIGVPFLVVKLTTGYTYHARHDIETVDIPIVRG